MNAWVAYGLGVSQNVVAAIVFGPWLLREIRKLHEHIERVDRGSSRPAK